MARRILIVDDSAASRAVVASALEPEGYEVLAAEDGEAALERLREAPVDLVITDVNMPRLDGFGLLEALRRAPETRFLPVLMLTTETAQKQKRRAREAGATGWIVKPFDGDRLLDVLQRVLPDPR